MSKCSLTHEERLAIINAPFPTIRILPESPSRAGVFVCDYFGEEYNLRPYRHGRPTHNLDADTGIVGYRATLTSDNSQFYLGDCAIWERVK